MNTSTISIPNDLIQELNKRKLDVNESYADVITRLMVADEDPVPLSEEEIAGIKEGLEDVKAGQIISAERLRYELGI
jgi:predicted CopG family antitoxin